MNQVVKDKRIILENNARPLPKKIGIIYSEVKREYFPSEAAYITEKDALKDALLIADYVKKLDIEPILYSGEPPSLEKIRTDNPEMIINLVGSVKGVDALAATIPGVLALLDVPFTGADLLGEALSYNKFLVKKLLQQAGVPVPNYQLFNTSNDVLNPELRFPLISKLNEIHGAVEITKDAVSEDEKALRERLKFLIKTYDQPVLVEEFIVGREVTAFVLEGLNKKVYMAEKVFNKPDDKYVFATFDDQWLNHEEDRSKWVYDYIKYDDGLLREYVKRAFDVARMLDYGKFDVRMDASGRYYFIDANSNPALGPLESECAISYVLNLYGITFSEILRRLIMNTIYGEEETVITTTQAAAEIKNATPLLLEKNLD